MKLNKLHNALVFLLCVTTVACNKNGVQHEPDTDGKTPISLSIGGIDSSTPETKAVITDGTNHTMKPFDVQTNVFIVMKSEYGTADYQGSHDTKYTVARGDIKKESPSSGTNLLFDTENQKYWNDAHARSSQLTMWAYAQKGQSGWKDCTFEVLNPSGEGINKYKDQPYNTRTNIPWNTEEIYPAIRYWFSSIYDDGSQDSKTVECQDLLFSNNIANYVGDEKVPEDSRKDDRLKFHFDTTPKYFDGGQMYFYHAMSKITIKLIAKDGFIGNGNDFQFKNGSNVSLSNLNKGGLFNIKTGQFEYIWNLRPNDNTRTVADPYPYTVTKMYQKPANPCKYPDVYYVLEALAVPNITGNTTPSIEDSHSIFKNGSEGVSLVFTIDDNEYQVSSDALFAALKANSGTDDGKNGLAADATQYPLEAGKNYIFTFTVSKTKIDNITATVADWEDVEAEEQEPSNARISLKLEERTGTLSDDAVVDIYRAANVSSTIDDGYTSYAWETGYNGNVSKYKKEDGNWTLLSDWFWPNNKTFYHFRALMPSEMTVNTQANPGDYISIASGKLSGGTSYKDVVWGAPMLDNANDDIKGEFKWTYSIEKGFDVTNPSLETGNHQIYKAIGPSEDPIKLVLFHMMSQLKFTITTTTGSDAVELGDGTTDAKKTQIELLDIHTGGKLLLGNGLVSVTGESSPATELDKIWDASEKNICQFGVVPQSLSNVKLRITTPDGNQYIVDLKDVVASGSNITNNNIANPYTKIPEGQPNAGKYTIDRWYPGFKYNYTFKLKKTGIDNIQATIVDWENVDVDEGEVTIQ